jgi:hypothetical protein
MEVAFRCPDCGSVLEDDGLVAAGTAYEFRAWGCEPCDVGYVAEDLIA